MTLTDLHTPADPLFPQLLALYLASFPASERKPPAAVETMLSSPIYRVRALHRGPTLFGLAILTSPRATPGVTLLEYLAVAPHHRGTGLGRHLLSTLAGTLAPGQHLLIEAEAPAPHAPPHDPQHRRLRFYRSLGARTLAGLAWRMPQVADTPPPPMLLLALTPAPAPIPRNTLRQWLTALYTEVYTRPADDPNLAAMLAPLPDPVLLT